MKFVSWNVNGLRACMNKGFMDVFESMDADFFCLQETKLQAGQIQLELPGYHQYWCYAEKKGYSGTAIFTRHEPQSVSYGLGIPELDTEGRVICLEYPEFYLVTCYTPNAQRGLARIGHRLQWEAAFRSYLKELDSKKPVVICGDLNVAHKEIDLKNPGSNKGNAGFSDEERSAFSDLLASGFTDTFRHLYPTKTGAYSWWSYMWNARQNNAGWRIDYFLVSDRMKGQIYAADIHPDVMGSDHCPVSLDLDTTCNGGLHIPVPDHAQTPTNTEADGDAPIGSVHFGMIATVAALILLLTIPLYLLSRTGTQQDPTRPTQDQMISSFLPGPMFHQVLDRTGILEFQQMTATLTSSSIGQYLVCGEERWLLEGFDQDPVYVSRPINFHLQVIFDPDRTFYPEDKPEVTVAIDDAYDGALKVETICHYREDDRIAGCFISGYAYFPTPVEIRVSYNEITQLLGPITVTPHQSFPLVTELEMYGADLTFTTQISSMSSVIPSFWFTHGDDQWEMLQTDGYSYPVYRNSIDFSLRLEFPATAQFTGDLKPTITAYFGDDSGSIEPEDQLTQVRYYLDENDRVAGAFVFGYLSADAPLHLRVTHNSETFQQTIPIEPDFAGMSTEGLAYAVATSSEVSYYILQEGDYLQDLLDNSQALRELLSRPYAFDNILRVNGNISYGSNFDDLLMLDYFQSKMTDAEKLLFQSQQERGIVYGDLIIAVPT